MNKRKVKNISIQILVFVFLLLLFTYFGFNYNRNINQSNIGVGFDFLNDKAGFSISLTLIPYNEADTYARVFLVGLLNTLVASISSIFLATLLGFLVSVMKRSGNKLIKKTAVFYIESLKKLPPLLLVLLFYKVIFPNSLPPLKIFSFLGPELLSVVIAIGVYTSSYISDIDIRSTRNSINQLMNQYLSIIKNTSLGMAVAYPELTAVFTGTTLSQTGRVPEVISLVTITYLSISLFTSCILNWLNRITAHKGDDRLIDEIIPNTNYINTLQRIRKNYFSTPANTVLSLFMLILLLKAMIWMMNWALINAVWPGEKRFIAQLEGARWDFISQKIKFFLFGFYPRNYIWRVAVTFLLMASSFIPYFYRGIKHKAYIFISQMITWPMIILFFTIGGIGLEKVPSSDLGGLTLTLILFLLGLLYSFPLGILLTICSRSELQIIKRLSTVCIEFFSRTPLIIILFFFAIAVPFLLPPLVSLDMIFRIIIGITLYQSAYLADLIERQYKPINASDLGLKKRQYLVIIHKGCNFTIPNLGNIIISFLINTTLVMIIGMYDLLGIVSPLTNESIWLGMDLEGFIFVGVIYWLMCFSISRITNKIGDMTRVYINGRE